MASPPLAPFGGRGATPRVQVFDMPDVVRANPEGDQGRAPRQALAAPVAVLPTA